MDFIHNAFQKLVNETSIIPAFFYAMSGLAALLVLIDALRTYSDIIVKQSVSPWKMGRPFLIIMLIMSWPSLYKGLNYLFDGIQWYFESYLANQLSDGETDVISVLFSEIANDSKFSVLQLSIGSIMMSLLAFVLGFIHWLMDVFISLYIDINELILALFAPIALVLMLIREMSSTFMTWLRLYAKFRFFMLAVFSCDFLALSLMKYVKSELLAYLDVPGELIAITGVNTTINIVCLTAFIVFKIIYLSAAYRTLDAILQSGDLGVGSATGGLVRGMITVTQKVATKGV